MGPSVIIISVSIRLHTYLLNTCSGSLLNSEQKLSPAVCSALKRRWLLRFESINHKNFNFEPQEVLQTSVTESVSGPDR